MGGVLGAARVEGYMGGSCRPPPGRKEGAVRQHHLHGTARPVREDEEGWALSSRML